LQPLSLHVEAALHLVVSRRQVAVQDREPNGVLGAADVHVLLFRSAPSHCSPGSMTPLPHNAAMHLLVSNVHDAVQLNVP
jgi:hypothetical protein